ncbi:hypothetical protein SAMN02745206_01555 [Desulfacinum infernum DSM 9756]|jgi:hypothetical protein|uniref:Thioredoxin domain-containing protein n=1 Tax=Desulfacinum infernum DSM 9756 TaxID=1121391 RepID=A0A1M4ZVY5_9BACT|nr:hypothetical protein [Desulfacinum infernum]SHF22230.1 hypothetical protein SAMN02745206_01555 [Desulfacinum infernum DSM 9756]
MEITLLFAPGCAAQEPTQALVRSVLERLRIPADVRVVMVEDTQQAQSLSFPGSPTVRVNGSDIEPEGEHAFQYGLG